MIAISLTDAATAFEPNEPMDRVASVTPEHLVAFGLDEAEVTLFLANRFLSRHPDAEDRQSVAA